MSQPIDRTHSYAADPAAQWLFGRAGTYGLEVITDLQQSSPASVDVRQGVISVRDGMEFPRLQWWVSRAIALTELGPAVVPDFLPVRQAGAVILPFLRRPW